MLPWNQSPQVGLPQHESRNTHPDEWHHRHDLTLKQTSLSEEQHTFAETIETSANGLCA